MYFTLWGTVYVVLRLHFARVQAHLCSQIIRAPVTKLPMSILQLSC